MSYLLKTTCWLVLFLLTSQLSAQSYRALLREGEQALAQTDYFAAAHYLRQALDKKEADAALWYAYARATHNLRAYELAETYYQKVIAAEGINTYPETNFHLGEIHKIMGDYPVAEADFRRFLQQKIVPPELKEAAQRNLQDCEWARQLGPATDSFTVERLGRRVNTPYSEFGAWQQGDTLFYSSFQYPLADDTHRPPRKISKVLYARGDGRGRPMGRDFNQDTSLTAHTSISSDGSRLYFTQCHYVNGSQIRCQLAYRERDKRGRWPRDWTLLPAAINLPDATHTQPSIGYDSLLAQEVLYYASDRPGGKGGLDIWWVYPPARGQKWPEPQPLTAINTAWDELTPFWHTVSQQLFFSSDGYRNLGGYDVYVSKHTQPEQWSAPHNLGPPLNSSYHDLYYFLGTDSAKGYLSSNRPGSDYLDADFRACCFDLYRFAQVDDTPVPDTLPPLATIPDQPVTTPEPREPATLEEFLPLSLYFDNDEPDPRTRRTRTRQQYADTYESYRDRQPLYARSFPDTAAIAAFFQQEVTANFDKLNRFSEQLLDQLRKGEEFEIFLKGYTSPRAEGDYNLRLGKRRVSAVRNHFLTYRDGVFAPFLEAEKLRITEVSFGETRAAGDVSDDLNDVAASVFSPAAARERRVEIVEIERY